ncbi:Eco57I restriction-modification methylase domain-containing protein [Paracoccus sp. (in: a-proteobacteria)]|uniref:Eco57I restriction-modification methylase domain-containing protein n=1 Tax=Paracoccus sp. TaxID=267 RepID=UPI0028A08DF3|nr:type IIL restriction-modification enzyme MmeI [Paracoccus sp. (in: a-proteobacteria)]
MYGGIDHPTLQLPALGGSLFDPDRYPLLEGRKKCTSWRSDPAEPLPIDDRTVLLLLDAIQIFEGRTLSYRALDVEQIGHVYEGLLERTVKRVDDVTLELDSGTKAKSPRVTLGEMESARLDGAVKVAELLKERSERSESAIRNALDRTADDRLSARLLSVCRGDVGLRDRILPYAPLLRTDPWGYPLVHHKGAFVVVLGADRRESGTHYTPKSLTEKIVAETLTPVAYRGPAEGKAPEEWELKSAEELLDLKICDPAMGSGAFLVQACRWLSDRLVEAWAAAEANGMRIDSEGRIFDDAIEGADPLSQDVEERAIVARRLVAERCIYGVDKNLLAVELAKLSLWLTTMSKGRPFGFLDHNLRSGDSLLGIHDIRQLTELSMVPKGSTQLRLFGRSITAAVEKATELRTRLRSIPIRDIGDVNAMAALDAESRRALLLPQAVADAFVGIILAGARATERADRLQALETLADAAANGTEAAVDRLRRDAMTDLRIDAPDALSRDPFHWPLQFPEVFGDQRDGFDAFIGNPPFLGGQKITGAMGTAFREFLVENIAGGMRGSADFVAYFFLRAYSLLSERGLFGLIAVNTIAEGDTRDVGLGQLLKAGGQIIAAYPNEVWPGTANVVTSRVHIAKSSWGGTRQLNGKTVAYISSHLGEVEAWSPKKLESNAGLVFQGSITLGDGFLVDADFVAKTLAENREYEKIVYPYLIGREVNQHPEHEPGRHVINFFDWTEEASRRYSSAFARVEREVRPEREKQNDAGAKRAWWLHLRPRPELYHKIGRGELFQSHPSDWIDDSHRLERVIVFATGATKYPCFTMVPNEYIYANTVCVVASDSFGLLGCLSSDIHAVWAWEQGSRMKQDLRYTHGDIFETFPLPDGLLQADTSRLSELGEELFRTRREVMRVEQKGLTSFYNDFHSPHFRRQDVGRCREIQSSLNGAVLEAYGLDEIDLELGFHEVGYLPAGKNTRFTMSEKARRAVLNGLSEINKSRYLAQEESKASKRRKPGQNSRKSKRSVASSDQASLNLDAPAKPRRDSGDANGAAEKIVTHLKARRSWLSKSDILAYVDIPDGQWNAAINDLLASGTVEYQGERGSARYRISESD